MLIKQEVVIIWYESETNATFHLGTFFWSTYEQQDSEAYEKPDLYHVTFFDAPNQPVTRAWMHFKNMTSLTSENLQVY